MRSFAWSIPLATIVLRLASKLAPSAASRSTCADVGTAAAPLVPRPNPPNPPSSSSSASSSSSPSSLHAAAPAPAPAPPAASAAASARAAVRARPASVSGNATDFFVVVIPPARPGPSASDRGTPAAVLALDAAVLARAYIYSPDAYSRADAARSRRRAPVVAPRPRAAAAGGSPDPIVGTPPPPRPSPGRRDSDFASAGRAECGLDAASCIRAVFEMVFRPPAAIALEWSHRGRGRDPPASASARSDA